jgi:hypothetical protein
VQAADGLSEAIAVLIARAGAIPGALETKGRQRLNRSPVF